MTIWIFYDLASSSFYYKKIEKGTGKLLFSFDLISSSGNYDIRVYSSILNRYGKVYRGNVQVDDGFDDTSWRDYYNWHFEIEDNNDWDGDGIPDLTDP